jgi:predicted XRE-type DNA-binding protein
MAKKSAITVTPSSGNVFADLGFAEPEEELAKAQLASRIQDIIKQQHLTQTAAASLMGIDQPKVSALLNGRLANFSSGRLMRLLIALGQDVEIVIRPRPRRRSRGRIRVVEAHV